MPEYDGSLDIHVGLDKEQFEKELNELKKSLEEKKAQIDNLKSQYSRLSSGEVKTKEQLNAENKINQLLEKRNDIVSKLWGSKNISASDVSKLNTELNNTNYSLEKLKNKLDKLEISPTTANSVKELSKDINKAEKEAAKLSNTITKKLEKSVSDQAKSDRLLQQIKARESLQAKALEEKFNREKFKAAERAALEQARAAERAQNKIERAKERAQLRAERAALEQARAAEKEQLRIDKAEKEQLRLQLKAQKQAELQEQNRIEITRKAIDGLKSATYNFGNSFKKVFSSLLSPIKYVIDSIGSLGRRILRLGSYVLVFQVIRSGFRSLRDYISGALSTNAVFMDSLNKLKSNLMVAFYPIYQFILPALNTLMSFLIKASSYLANFLSMVTGTTIKQSEAGARAIYSQQQAMKSSGDTTKESTKAINDQKASFDKLGKSIKGSKKELASFDKLIILGQNKEKAAKTPKSPKADDFVFMPDTRTDSTYNNIVTIFDKISKKLEPLKVKFKELGDTIKTTIGKFAVQAFKDFNTEFTKPLANWAIDKGLPKFIDITDKMLKNIDWDKLNNSLKGFWKALEPFTEHIGDGLIRLYDKVLSKVIVFTIDKALPATLDALGHSLKWIDDNIGADNIAMSLIAGIGTYKTVETIQKIIKWVNELRKTYEKLTTAQIILQAFSGPAGWAALAAGSALAIGIGIKKVNDLELDNMLKYNKKTKEEFEKLTFDEQNKLWDSWKDHIQRVYGDVTAGREKALDKMLKDTGITYEEFNNMDLKQRAELVKNWAASEAEAHGLIGKERDQFIANQSKEIMSSIGLWDLFKQRMKELVRDTKEAFKGIGEFFKGLWSELKPKWQSDLNFLIGKVENFVNRCIDGLNWLIKKANNISFNMPDWLGGGHFGINISEIPKASIPRLAQGAVLKGGDPILAYLNDQPRGQTNIETPLDTMVQAFNEALSNNNANGNVVIQADGDVAGIVNMLRFRIKQRDELIGTNYIQDGIFA